MSTTILRYRVPLKATVEVAMPAGATLIRAGPPRDRSLQLDLWAVVDPDAPAVARVLHVVGAGREDVPASAQHVATVPTHGGDYVWHVFDGGQADRDAAS